MEKQEFKSKWDELARELGADVSPEIEQREETISDVVTESAAPDSSEAAPAIVRPPVPKRAAADWDKLAGDLGLPPGEPESAPIEEPREEPREKPRPAPVEHQESRRPQMERSHREPRERRGQRPEKRSEPREKRSEPRDRHRPPPAKHRERRPRDADVSSEADDETMREAETSPTPSSLQEEPAKSAAVSLWHKIFGSPAEQTAKITEITSTTREPRESFETPSTAESPSIASSDSIRSLSGEDVAAAAFVEELDRDDESAQRSDEAVSEEGKRGRPRRRRRGGRGRKTSERPGETRRARHEDEISDEALELDDELDDLGGAETADDISDSQSRGDQYDADEESDGAPIDAADSTRIKAAQRTIPSWEEAIGFIVDSNMQTRSQRRPPSRPHSRTNSARGRPRGRRKN
ncbi:MAG: hypothetical protein WD738_13965 [Pirellulales bacterium]